MHISAVTAIKRGRQEAGLQLLDSLRYWYSIYAVL